MPRTKQRAAAMPLNPFFVSFSFHDFSSRPAELDEGIVSVRQIDCYGNSWMLTVCPGLNDSGEPMVGVVLGLEDKHARAGKDVIVDAYFTVILRDARGKVYSEPEWTCPRQIMPTAPYLVRNLVERSEVLDPENNILRDGALLIEVHFQFVKSLREPKVNASSTSLGKNMLRLLENGHDADVLFKVKGEMFDAHKLVLKMNSSVLSNFCEENSGSPICIDCTTPKIFRIVLRYVYGEEVPSSEEILENGKDIIEAANKFGVVGLKLAVETILVESILITTKNVAEWLIFSDAKTCPLLKEQATMYFLSRPEDILNSEASAQLRESPLILTELIIEQGKSPNRGCRHVGSLESTLSVTELRIKLANEGLDVDGSKETLVARLETFNNKRQRTE